MKMYGQRWTYRIGNSVIHVDNGFAWSGWGQERMVVNDGTAQSTDGWFRMRQSYFEPWIVPDGEGVLAVKLVAGMMRVQCSAELDGAPLEPSEMLKANWSGPQNSWPDDVEWTPVAA